MSMKRKLTLVSVNPNPEPTTIGKPKLLVYNTILSNVVILPLKGTCPQCQQTPYSCICHEVDKFFSENLSFYTPKNGQYQPENDKDGA